MVTIAIIILILILIIFNIIMFMISIILTTKIIITKTVTNAKYYNQWAADFTARLLALIRFNMLFILNNIPSSEGYLKDIKYRFAIACE